MNTSYFINECIGMCSRRGKKSFCHETSKSNDVDRFAVLCFLGAPRGIRINVDRIMDRSAKNECLNKRLDLVILSMNSHINMFILLKLKIKCTLLFALKQNCCPYPRIYALDPCLILRA